MTKNNKQRAFSLTVLAITAAFLLSLTACSGQASSGTATSDKESADSSQSASHINVGFDTAYADLSSDIAFVFSDTGISAFAESGYTVDGTELTITSPGIYVVSGTCGDGLIKVEKGVENVTIILKDLSLSSDLSAPIICGKNSAVTIVAYPDTVNTLSDSESNNDDSFPDNLKAENAVIKCKSGSQVVICGTGTLNISANGKNGIKSSASDDENDETSLTIRELTVNITAEVNDAINAERILNIESGNITISAGDDGIHSDLIMNIGSAETAGPAITINKCYEGIEAAKLTISSGNITIHAEDDCLNAANSDLSNYEFTLDINGGTLCMDTSSGDGIDSNGSLSITGGTVIVWSANSADNQPLDADGTISITGGTVFAAGGSYGMGMQLYSEQAYIMYGMSETSFGQGAQQGFLDGSRGTPPSGIPEKEGNMPLNGESDGSRNDISASEPAEGSYGKGPFAPPTGDSSPEQSNNKEFLDEAFQPGSAPAEDGMTPPDIPGSFKGAASAVIAAGNSFTICDAAGNVIYSGSALYDVSFILFSSPELSEGSVYTLSSAEDSSLDASAVCS